MKVVRINGRNVKVFVLQETETALVYIPVNAIQRVDYNRLLEIEKRGGNMLNEMRKTKLDNGRNALTQYDNIIQVMHFAPSKKDEGVRIPKPEDSMAVQRKYEEIVKEYEEQKKSAQQTSNEQSEPTQNITETVSETANDQPKRRGPGRHPKKKED